jgi:hypothetical protein
MDLAKTGSPGLQVCCSRLRWKGMYVDVERDPTIPNPRDGFFWCSLTMTCLGPDGQICQEGRCCGGRTCFDPL